MKILNSFQPLVKTFMILISVFVASGCLAQNTSVTSNDTTNANFNVFAKNLYSLENRNYYFDTTCSYRLLFTNTISRFDRGNMYPILSQNTSSTKHINIGVNTHSNVFSFHDSLLSATDLMKSYNIPLRYLDQNNKPLSDSTNTVILEAFLHDASIIMYDKTYLVVTQKSSFVNHDSRGSHLTISEHISYFECIR